MSTDLNARITEYEQNLGHDMTFLREILKGSASALRKFFQFMPLANHGANAPQDALQVARLVASRSEDCGPCLQINVDFAKGSDLDPDTIQAVLDHQIDALPDHLALIYRFADAVCNQHPDSEIYRRQIEAQLGHGAMVDLALAMATTRVFPMVKRGLGLNKSIQQHPVSI